MIPQSLMSCKMKDEPQEAVPLTEIKQEPADPEVGYLGLGCTVYRVQRFSCDCIGSLLFVCMMCHNKNILLAGAG